MRSLYRSAGAAALASGLFLTFSQGASAATVSITSQVSTGDAPLGVSTTPASDSGNFMQSVTGSFGGGVGALSPYVGNTGAGADGSAAATDASYSVLGAGAGTGAIGSATYNVNSSSLSFLWGSPDPYNSVAFFSGANGTGTQLGSFTGSDLACFATGTCKDDGFDLVTFTALGGDIGSIVLNNDTAAAFEFNFEATPTPLPSAIYLFGGVLGAAFWVSRRKRGAVSSLGVA